MDFKLLLKPKTPTFILSLKSIKKNNQTNKTLSDLRAALLASQTG